MNETKRGRMWGWDASVRAVLVAVAVVGLLACDGGDAVVSLNNPACVTDGFVVGETCVGGVVYAVNFQGSGETLILHPSDFGPTQYKDTNDATVPTPNNQDDGRLATGTFDTNHLASLTCQNLASNGYSDWYLPAVNELGAMESPYNLGMLPIPGATEFWSATDVNSDTTAAYSVDLSGGPGGISNGKTGSLTVRCIRRG
jgi:hypothetical protein